jgi:ATP-dependent helicase/nuclease subunit A
MQPSLFDQPVDEHRPPDQAARDFSVDPSNNVVLEASAGTGKTRVLVDRYVRLIEKGVDPRHILAITFTRKAAAEMRERVLVELARQAATSVRMAERWNALRDRIADIQISTIDAFCFGLLREFPLEADVDPGFEIADETEMARFQSEAIELTLRAARHLMASDERVRLLFARVKLPVLKDALGTLVDRRHVALPAVRTFVSQRVTVEWPADAAAAFLTRVRNLFAASAHRKAILDDGPHLAPEFQWLHADLAGLDVFPAGEEGRVSQFQRRLERYFLTKDGKPRQRLVKPFTADRFASADARKRHEAALAAISPEISGALDSLAESVNGLLSRGLLRVLAIAVDKYEALLDEHALLDFAAMLAKAVTLLERQEEFARSRLKLQSRYHHVLVDEFQDTSRLQWRLVELLIEAWAEGDGTADAPMSIFLVGDRKQSIYRFRHAEVTLLDEASRRIAALRPGRAVRQAITNSFRAVPELLAFINALAEETQGDPAFPERFSYTETDRFPATGVEGGARRDGEPVLGVIAEPSMARCAEAVAAEIERLLAGTDVRDRSGTRPARPDDIAILFRARAGHQCFESALEARAVRTYVYKGLGFFDAPEVQDLQALMRYLAQPESDLRAAEFLRSRIVRVSDVGLTRLAPSFAGALRLPSFEVAGAGLDDVDRATLERARESVARWLVLADRILPSELVDIVLRESAYAFELRGRRLDQARENVKKARALVRRVENRGYATLGRIAEYFETLRTGEESNATIEAAGCVNLMTIHAAKGLEFPIVFLVNLQMQGRGRSAGFTIVDRGPGGEPAVAFGTNEVTELEDKRDEEELRRLLYVAVTRARDRVYLAGEVDRKGKLKRGGRSLASLLPSGLTDVFGAAALSDQAEIEWQSQTGAFAFRVCRPVPSSNPQAERVPLAPEHVDLVRLRSAQPVVVAATAVREPVPRAGAGAAVGASSPGDRLVGTIVHRLFRRWSTSGSRQEIAQSVPHVFVTAELVDSPDLGPVVDQAVDLFLALRSRPDVNGLLASGECYYEVPFSFRAPGRTDQIVRGSVDCLVVAPGGDCTILEFKTGAPRPEHEAQTAVYLEAFRAALPGRVVESRVVYR